MQRRSLVGDPSQFSSLSWASWQRERGLFCKGAKQWHFNSCDPCKGDLTCVCFLTQYVCTWQWQWQWQTKEKQRQMLFYFLAHLLGQSLWSMKNNCLVAQLQLNRLFSIPTMLAQYRNIQDDIISQHQIPFCLETIHVLVISHLLHNQCRKSIIARLFVERGCEKTFKRNCF